MADDPRLAHCNSDTSDDGLGCAHGCKELDSEDSPCTIGEIPSFSSSHRSVFLSCALVSWEWLFEGRPLLFRHIDLFRKPHNRFVSKVLHSDRLQFWLPSILYLAFTGLESFIVDISGRLSNLRSMKWGYIWCRGALRPEVFPAFGIFAHLRHLELVSYAFVSFGDFKKIVVAFPALSSLMPIDVWWTSADPDGSPSALAPAPTRPTLSKLSASMHCYGPRKPEDGRAAVAIHRHATSGIFPSISALTTLDMRMRVDDDNELFGKVRFEFLSYDHVLLIHATKGNSVQFARLQ